MFKLIKVQCQKCGHEWLPRVPDPRSCPNCGSLRWDKPKKDKKDEQQYEEE